MNILKQLSSDQWTAIGIVGAIYISGLLTAACAPYAPEFCRRMMAKRKKRKLDRMRLEADRKRDAEIAASKTTQGPVYRPAPFRPNSI